VREQGKQRRRSLREAKPRGPKDGPRFLEHRKKPRLAVASLDSPVSGTNAAGNRKKRDELKSDRNEKPAFVRLENGKTYPLHFLDTLSFPRHITDFPLIYHELCYISTSSLFMLRLLVLILFTGCLIDLRRFRDAISRSRNDSALVLFSYRTSPLALCIRTL